MKPLGINLRQVETHPVQLVGEMPATGLDIETLDALIEVVGPFRYALEVELHGDALLLTGSLELPLRCTCARCLKEFPQIIRLEHWTGLAPLEGEEGLQSQGDWVDLTPLLRDDLMLAFPQHPLCDATCSGLASPAQDQATESGGTSPGDVCLAEWSVLDRLKL